ncbi:MAG: aminotransferase class V-fold PLP-dependent enzyme [Psychroflexus sp.]
MKDFKNAFPLLNSYTYLNTPYTGLISEELKQYRQFLDNEFQLKGSLFADEFETDIVETTKANLSKIYSAKPKHIGLVNNFSVGMNLILNDLPPKSKVLLLKEDYPSVNFPVKSRDFSVSEIGIHENLEQDIRATFEQNQPDFFIFSITQFISGIKIDLEFLKTLKQDFPETFFIADATQYCGVEAFDFENSGIDVFGTSAYKWLNAGLGNGFFLFKPEFLERFNFKSIGSNSLDEKPDGKPRATGFLEPGHYDLMAIASLNFALKYHYETLGIQEIETQIKPLSKLAKTEFAKHNLLENAVLKRNISSNIFSLKGDENLVEHLQKNNILTAFRGGQVRVGFQYFNTENDLDKLLSAISKLS